jgi:hypothetical protein
LLTACSAALALAVAGCGGDDGGGTAQVAAAPKIDSAVVEQLASRADEVARRLESADPCGAANEAAQLRAELTTAINDKAIPQVYLDDLSLVVNELVDQIPACPPPPEETTTEQEKGDGEEDD